jgi:hypothetical protein
MFQMIAATWPPGPAPITRILNVMDMESLHKTM